MQNRRTPTCQQCRQVAISNPIRLGQSGPKRNDHCGEKWGKWCAFISITVHWRCALVSSTLRAVCARKQHSPQDGGKRMRSKAACARKQHSPQSLARTRCGHNEHAPQTAVCARKQHYLPAVCARKQHYPLTVRCAHERSTIRTPLKFARRTRRCALVSSTIRMQTVRNPNLHLASQWSNATKDTLHLASASETARAHYNQESSASDTARAHSKRKASVSQTARVYSNRTFSVSSTSRLPSNRKPR